MWKCNSLKEAVDWARQCPNPAPGEEAELELRQVFQAEDFATPSVPEIQTRSNAALKKLGGRKLQIGTPTLRRFSGQPQSTSCDQKKPLNGTDRYIVTSTWKRKLCGLVCKPDWWLERECRGNLAYLLRLVVVGNGDNTNETIFFLK